MPTKHATGVVTPKQAPNPLATATQQLRNLFEESGQAMYLYLDDHNKACNERFAQLLGYATPEAWAAVHTPFPSAFVAPASQGDLVAAYQAAMNDAVAAQVPVTWRRKDGRAIDSQVILVPLEVEGARLALHFVTA